MTTKKIEWQRETFENVAGVERELCGCPVSILDDFAACMTLFNQHIEASDDDASIQQLYEENDHFREVTDKALAMCGINPSAVTHNHIAELLHSYMDEKDGAFYPGRLIQINFPYSKKYRFSPFENIDQQLYPDLVNVIEELTSAVELIEEIEKTNGSSSDNNV